MRKTILCLGLSFSALTVGTRAHAQFAPSHTTEYLDSRRESELRHQTLARMLMTIGMNPADNAPVVTDTSSTFSTPVRPFEPRPRKPRVRGDDSNAYGLHQSAAPYLAERPAPAVVQVNREIAFSMTGGWSDLRAHLPDNQYISAHGHETAWVPGFQLDASTMFDLEEVSNILLAVHFSLGDGDTRLRGKYYLPYFDDGDRGKTTGNRLTTDTRGEIGKGLMVSNLFMITPSVQAGYRTWNRDVVLSDDIVSVAGSSGNALAGILIHLDYAATDSFVIRGRLGWAEIIGARLHSHALYGNLRESTRSEWDAALDFDYRISSALHFVAGVQYRYDAFGRLTYSRHSHDDIRLQADNRTHYVTLHTGLAYAF
ncbi:hypothetical protein GOB93_18390 [Acetobacter musti]|uniref:Outer membrane protein beta-barrel domain-containing protein n=1 Tax=Acetobacter musti TaxID=864732 RepID=A0ABX0JUD0_9PROT|nr:hypothetical protein [Acetobacter musti]NHN86580.1 hypothetical protein [Acetobacter musti]